MIVLSSRYKVGVSLSLLEYPIISYRSQTNQARRFGQPFAVSSWAEKTTPNVKAEREAPASKNTGKKQGPHALKPKSRPEPRNQEKKSKRPKTESAYVQDGNKRSERGGGRFFFEELVPVPFLPLIRGRQR